MFAAAQQDPPFFVMGMFLGLALAVILLIGLVVLASYASEEDKRVRQIEETKRHYSELEKSRARRTVLDKYASLGAKLGPNVPPSWIQQRIAELIDSAKVPEAGEKQEGGPPKDEAVRICDELRRMAAWAQLRSEWRRNQSQVCAAFPETKLEEFIEKNLGHDQPADTVESAAKGMVAWFSSLPMAPVSPSSSAGPLAGKKEALRQQRDRAVDAARASGDEACVVEARIEQIEEEYQDALGRLEGRNVS